MTTVIVSNDKTLVRYLSYLSECLST